MLLDNHPLYQMGLGDGYDGMPPEHRFLNVTPRSDEEWEIWWWGHRDGAALRALEEREREEPTPETRMVEAMARAAEAQAARVRRTLSLIGDYGCLD